MLIAVSVLLALNIPVLTFCTADKSGGAVESALCEDGENSTKYRVGIAAYSGVTDAETAETMRAAIADGLCGGGLCEEEFSCEYMLLRDTGELDEVLEMMCRGCDAVFTLDSVSTSRCAAVYGKNAGEELAPLFFCCADEESAFAAMDSGMAAGSICKSAAPMLADIVAEMTAGEDGKAAKPGVVYNSAAPESSEAVCSGFDAEGVDYAACAPDDSRDIGSAVSELTAAGADLIVVPYPLLPRYEAASVPEVGLPVFCMEPTPSGGISVSLSPDAETGASMASCLAARLFNGEPLSALESSECPYLLTVSRLAAEKFSLKIPESTDEIKVVIIE
ncbi:MAG: hypothetical protein ACI4SJ_04855 [Candidatus Avispirillum sp.]